jgi:hypothetical protein
MTPNPSEIAMSYLASEGVDCAKLAVGKIAEFDWGWSVHINAAEYWETKDHYKMLVGLSPVFVSRQARCRLFMTGMSYEEMCSEFARECAA